MAGLVLEGGSFRPIFSAGVMDALLDNDIIFDYVIGVSAGIANGVSYVSKQRGRNLEIMQKYRNDHRYMTPVNFIKERSLFGLDFIYEEIPKTLIPFDYKEYMDFNGKVNVGLTNAITGMPEYFDGKQLDEKNMLLRATCALPLYFPAIQIAGKPYYDGGLTDSIPIKKSIEDGNIKNLIILTQPKGYVKKSSKNNKAVSAVLGRKYPNLINAINYRPKLYNDTIKFIEEIEAKNPDNTVVLRPENMLNSFESDIKKLEENYKAGYDIAINNLGKIKKLLD